ncbi:aldo/keto reductase [Synechococcus sp. YX-04-1]|uniref:aldo/keto reductase n=1 Tax=Synechococcus sp. YX-04-1 TaxID=3062778 RepID=UPI0026E302E4|nr:aldo/keto reductase [Synechococcus sp. YX-04-1]MDO6351094.1 aldo/keto reductase [Synechococcus sp. YX-04-1]
MKLGIGTAQFGLNYGVNNKNGIPDLDEIRRILDIARGNNIKKIDTAMSYGDAHIKLGKAGVQDFEIGSKIPRVEGDTKKEIRTFVINNVERTLAELRIDSIHRIFLHNHKDYNIHKEAIQEAIGELKNSGKVYQFGVSMYRPNDIIKAAEDKQLDVFQVPINILDRSFEMAGFIEHAIKNKKIIQARSVFLQGLLLKDLDKLGSHFEKWQDIFEQLEDEAKERNMTRKELALSYILDQNIESFVIGIETSRQLKELIVALERLSATRQKKYPHFKVDEDLINPTKWPR